MLHQSRLARRIITEGKNFSHLLSNTKEKTSVRKYLRIALITLIIDVGHAKGSSNVTIVWIINFPMNGIV